MNSIMRKLSSLVLIVCCFALVIANDVSYTKKIKDVYSIEQIASENSKKNINIDGVTYSINNTFDSFKSR